MFLFERVFVKTLKILYNNYENFHIVNFQHFFKKKKWIFFYNISEYNLKFFLNLRETRKSRFFLFLQIDTYIFSYIL